MPRRNRETKLIFAVLAVFFVAFLAVPMIQVLMKSVMTDSGAGISLRQRMWKKQDSWTI